MTPDYNYGIQGLNAKEVLEARSKFGQNEVA